MRLKKRPAINILHHEVALERTFDAPRDLVWRAFTEAELIKKWWGPKDFTSPFCRIDFREGGNFLCCMRSSDGHDYWSTGVYREIIPQEAIVSTDSFADEKGNVVPASFYGMDERYPLEMLVRIIFEDDNGKTRITLRQSGHPTKKMRELAQAGWNESLDKLAESLDNFKQK